MVSELETEAEVETETKKTVVKMTMKIETAEKIV